MGGMLQYRNFNQGKASQKISINRRHADGLEAPRNSLELPTETSKSYQTTVHENIPFSLQVQQHHIEHQLHHPGGITMKKLIDKEIPSNTTRHSAPSVIARLMGMDTLPSEGRVPVHSNDYRNENSSKYLPSKKNFDETSSQYKQLRVMSSKQKNQELSVYDLKQDDTNGCTNSPRLTKPHRREHPQEELLQKFKKEFKAWQAAMVWERSRAVGLDDSHLRKKFEKQNEAMYADTERNSFCRTSAESLTSSTDILGTKSQGSFIQHDKCVSKEGLPSLVEARNSRNRKKSNDLAQYPGMKLNKKGDRSSPPARIVILKPSTETTGDTEESWPCSSGILQGEGSMEYFLEEVRERLRLEIQGKARNEIKTSKYSGEIPFSETLTDPKQIAQHIAKQIRESVTRDLGTTLMRSESTRSYRSESQLNGPDAQEFINRTTGKCLSDRLRNVLRNEADIGVNAVASGRLGPSSVAKESARLRHLGKSSYSEDTNDATEVTTLSFREEQMDNGGSSTGYLSPRNLMRSLSAPVSGTAFGKLILEEDQNVWSGAHIRRKHESTEGTSVEVGEIKKEVSNFKGRVPNLRHNLTLPGKIFGSKVQSANEAGGKTFDSVKAIAASPAVMLNLGISQENSTELPPSPASVSGSSFDDLCKPSNPSPVSPLELPFTEEHLSLQNSETTSNLPATEVRCQLSKPVGIATLDEVSNGEELYDDATDMRSPEGAYLRNILITAGLYDKSLDQIYASFDVETGPIAESVLGKVGRTRAETENTNDGACPSRTVARRRILFDLLNEELRRVLSSPVPSSLLRSLGSTQAPRGEELLGDVRRRLETRLHPPADDSGSLDGLVACDLSMAAWSVLLQRDVDGVGGDVECMVLSELVDEFVNDLWG